MSNPAKPKIGAYKGIPDTNPIFGILLSLAIIITASIFGIGSIQQGIAEKEIVETGTTATGAVYRTYDAFSRGHEDRQVTKVEFKSGDRSYFVEAVRPRLFAPEPLEEGTKVQVSYPEGEPEKAVAHGWEKYHFNQGIFTLSFWGLISLALMASSIVSLRRWRAEGKPLIPKRK